MQTAQILEAKISTVDSFNSREQAKCIRGILKIWWWFFFTHVRVLVVPTRDECHCSRTPAYLASCTCIGTLTGWNSSGKIFGVSRWKPWLGQKQNPRPRSAREIFFLSPPLMKFARSATVHGARLMVLAFRLSISFTLTILCELVTAAMPNTCWVGTLDARKPPESGTKLFPSMYSIIVRSTRVRHENPNHQMQAVMWPVTRQQKISKSEGNYQLHCQLRKLAQHF